MRKDYRGYSMTFWAVFLGFVLIPSLALAIELGRYYYAITEVAKAADAAEVAASVEINQPTFQDSGALVPTVKHGRMLILFRAKHGWFGIQRRTCIYQSVHVCRREHASDERFGGFVDFNMTHKI